MIILWFLLAWLAFSLLISIMVGRFIRFGMGDGTKVTWDDEPVEKSADEHTQSWQHRWH